MEPLREDHSRRHHVSGIDEDNHRKVPMKLASVSWCKQFLSLIFSTCESTPPCVDWKSFSGGYGGLSAARDRAKQIWRSTGPSDPPLPWIHKWSRPSGFVSAVRRV